MINANSKLPQIMTPNMSVDKQSKFERRTQRKRNRYDINNIRSTLARSQISSQHNRNKDYTLPSETGVSIDQSFDRSRILSNISTPSKIRPITLFKAMDCAFKDLGIECKYARYKTNAGMNFSPQGKKSRLIRLKERLIKEIEETEPSPAVSIRPFEMAISYKEPNRRRPIVSLSQVPKTHWACKQDKLEYAPNFQMEEDSLDQGPTEQRRKESYNEQFNESLIADAFQQQQSIEIDQQDEPAKENKITYKDQKEKFRRQRLFENTGLTEETLKEITDREIERLTSKLDLVAQRNYDKISPRAKKILFDHGSKLIHKYDPKLHDALKKRKNSSSMEEKINEKKENIKRLKVPILKLRPQDGGPSIIYTEKSLQELSVNDTRYLMNNQQ